MINWIRKTMQTRKNNDKIIEDQKKVIDGYHASLISANTLIGTMERTIETYRELLAVRDEEIVELQKQIDTLKRELENYE